MPIAVRVVDRVQDMSDWNQSSFADGRIAFWDNTSGKYKGSANLAWDNSAHTFTLTAASGQSVALFQLQNSSSTPVLAIDVNAHFTFASGVIASNVFSGGGEWRFYYDSTNYIRQMYTGIRMGNACSLEFTSASDAGATVDVAVARASAGVVKVTDGSSGLGSLTCLRGTVTSTNRTGLTITTDASGTWDGTPALKFIDAVTPNVNTRLIGYSSTFSVDANPATGVCLHMNAGGMSNFVMTIDGGRVGIVTQSLMAQLGVQTQDPAYPASIFQAAASQTGNISEWQNSSGATLASLNSDCSILKMPASFAMGSGTHGTLGANSVAIGPGASADGDASVGIGYLANANGGLAIALGQQASAAASSFAIGFACTATNGGAAIGFAAQATGNQSIAVGTNANASASFSQAWGYNAQATATGEIVFSTLVGPWKLHGQYQTSTGDQRNIAEMAMAWVDATDATRTGRLTLGAFYTSTAQEAIRIDAGSDQARIGIGGVVVAGQRATVYSGVATDVALTVSGAASQTAPLFRVTTPATNDDPTVDIYQDRVATTDATVTALHSVATASDTAYLISARVLARRTGGSSGSSGDSAVYERVIRAKNVAGTVTLGTTQSVFTDEDQAGWDVTFDVSSTSVRVLVTGAANNNVTWHLVVLKVSPLAS